MAHFGCINSFERLIKLVKFWDKFHKNRRNLPNPVCVYKYRFYIQLSHKYKAV